MLIQDMSLAFGNRVLPSTSALVPAHVTAAPSANARLQGLLSSAVPAVAEPPGATASAAR